MLGIHEYATMHHANCNQVDRNTETHSKLSVVKFYNIILCPIQLHHNYIHENLTLEKAWR